MPEGPLGFRRLTTLGPLVSETEKKEVLGVAGTPFPNRPKSDLMIIHVLGPESRGFFNVNKAGSDIQSKVDARFDGIRINVLKSGRGAAKFLGDEMVFENQAVVVTVKGEALPITENELEDIQGIIERRIETEEVGIMDVIFDNS